MEKLGLVNHREETNKIFQDRIQEKSSLKDLIIIARLGKFKYRSGRQILGKIGPRQLLTNT